MPEVSVIVPVYNVSCYLRKCIDSILNQTYRDYELILVDDGSTDDSGSICDEYAQKDGRIRVIHKENGGLSSARNAGLRLATGEYIYFCDGDDYIESTLLECCISAVPGKDMVVFNYKKIDEKGNVLSASDFRMKDYKWDSDQQLLDFLISDFFRYSIGWEACFRVYRKSIIDRYGLYFEDNRVIFAEDKYFTLCYLLHAKSICCLSEALYYYVQRGDSIMGMQRRRYNISHICKLSMAVKKHLDSCEGLNEIKKYYPIIHLQFHKNVISSARKRNSALKMSQIRKIITEEIQDWDYYQMQTQLMPNCAKRYAEITGRINSTADVSEYMYYATGKPKYYITRRMIGGIRRLQDIFGLGGR